MEHNIIVTSANQTLGETLVRLFTINGYKASWANSTDTAAAAHGDHDLCVAYWTSPETCPVRFMRAYQTANPRGWLMCCSAAPGPAARAFLLGAGLTPDAVLPGPMSEEQIIAQARRLFALKSATAPEYLVLCVDDDRQFLRSLEGVLPDALAEKVPLETSCDFFEDPREAARLLSTHDQPGAPIAMVVTDHVMPGMNGVELLGVAKEAVPDAVRVLLTGHAGMDSVVTAVNRQTLDYYIAKPVEDINAFTQTLSHLLREYHLTTVNRTEAHRTFQQYEFLEQLVTLKTLEDTLQAVVDFVASSLDAERVSIMLRDGDRLVIRAARGVPEDVIASTSLPLGAGIAGKVFATGVPLHVSDAAELDIETEVDSSSLVFSSVPLLIAPMTVAEKPIGVINVTDRRSDKPLARGEMMFLSHTASAAAIAISNHLEHEQKELANFDTIRSLALAVEAKDNYTRGHSERVAMLSVMTADALGLEPEEIERLERAAIMHDVGKIGVPEEVLQKPGALSFEEYEQIRLHPVLGERIVSQLTFMAACLPIIRGHHERIDGRGYPDRLKGEQIPLGARIIAIADAYDAITSERPYRPAQSREAAVEELRRGAGTQFDPQCLEAFLNMLEAWPEPAAGEETKDLDRAGASALAAKESHREASAPSSAGPATARSTNLTAAGADKHRGS